MPHVIQWFPVYLPKTSRKLLKLQASIGTQSGWVEGIVDFSKLAFGSEEAGLVSGNAEGIGKATQEHAHRVV